MVTDNKLYKVAITVDGNYVHGKYYDTLTQVYYAEEDGGDGCSYVSVKPNQNVIPGTDDTVWKRSSRSGRGERGDKGDKGDTGDRGPQGKSAYQVAVDEGFEGDEESWLASLVGPQGPQGIQGARGPQGIQGATGPQGPQGNTGSSVDYPYELVNNRTTNDPTKGLSAAEGKRLGDDLSQLEAKVDNLVLPVVEDGYFIVDNDLNVGVRVDSDGLHAINTAIEYEIVN